MVLATHTAAWGERPLHCCVCAALISCPPQLWPGACSDYLCHLKEVRREQYSQGRIASDVPAPLEIQAIRDLVRARGREMQAENFNAHALVAAQVGVGLVRAYCANRMMACLTPACCLHLQVDAALSARQLRQSLQAAFQQKQWQWTYLLRMAMTFMPATLGRSDQGPQIRGPSSRIREFRESPQQFREFAQSRPTFHFPHAYPASQLGAG